MNKDYGYNICDLSLSDAQKKYAGYQKMMHKAMRDLAITGEVQIFMSAQQVRMMGHPRDNKGRWIKKETSREDS